MAIQSAQHSGITLPITMEFQQVAERFAQQCPQREKAEQIRRNTLAVCAVNAYLQLMEIPTNVGAGDSWNPMMQMMADVADLQVPGTGSLTCRPVALTDEMCYVPPEAWYDQAGYVAVALDEAAHEATLLGFLPAVDEIEQVPVARFAPMERLIDQVHGLESVASDALEREANPAPAQALMTQLGQWINVAIAIGWQTVEDLVNPTELNFAFRSTTAELSSRDTSASTISRAKLVDLGIQLDQSVRVALVIHLSQTETAQTEITLQVRPLSDAPAYLPADLSLTVLDDQGNTFLSATSRAIDNYIQLQLSGQTGETFGVQISMGETTFAEQFVI